MTPAAARPDSHDSVTGSTGKPNSNVLFVWEGLTRVGGVENFLYQCLRFMPATGIQPYILDVGPAVGAQDVQFGEFAPFILRAPELLDSSRSIWDTGVGRTLAEMRIDALVLNEWVYGRVLFDISVDVPVIAICHNDIDDREYYPSVRLYNRRLTSIVGVSSTICKKLKAHLPFWDRKKVTQISYGVEAPASTAAPGTDAGGLKLIYVGRVQQEQKRILDTVDFVRNLNERGVRSTVTIIGDGTDMAELQDRLGELHGPTTVRFLGAMLHRDALEELSTQDVFLLFSEHEGLPISLLEALVRGVVPVVSSVRSGILEILTKGKDAELFPIGRPDIAARLVDELSKDRSRLARLSEGARRVGSRYRIEEMIQRHSELIDRVVRSGGASSIVSLPHAARGERVERWWSRRWDPPYSFFGMADDGWVAPYGLLVVRRARVKGVRVDLDIPGWLPFTFPLRISALTDGHVLAEIEITRPGPHTLRIPTAGPGIIALKSEQWYVPASLRISPDRRNLCYRIVDHRALR